MRLSIAWSPLTALLLASACGDSGSDDVTTATTASSSTDPTTSPTTETSTSPTTTTPMESSSTEPMESSSGMVADSSSTDASESSSETAPVEFALTSPAFTEGGGIPGVHHVSGGNVSPQLDWVGVPDDALSLAVFFHDITIDFEHSAIWNIPADAIGLPEDVDHTAMPADVPGAVQCRSWIDEFGYGGPGSASNFYQFTLYALDVASVDEIDQDSDLVDVRAAFESHVIATATLSGQSTGPG